MRGYLKLFASIFLILFVFFIVILSEDLFVFPAKYRMDGTVNSVERLSDKTSIEYTHAFYDFMPEAKVKHQEDSIPDHSVEYFKNKHYIDNAKTIVYFGGNNEDVFGMFKYLRKTFPEVNVLAMNYPGYGISKRDQVPLIKIMASKMMRIIIHEFPNWSAAQSFYQEHFFEKETFENKIYRVVNGLWEKEKLNGDVYVIGRSLGSGVATEEAFRHKNVSRLLLITPFNNLPSVACTGIDILPVYVCKNWMDNIFDNESKISKVSAKVWVVYAKDDEVVPNLTTKRLLQFTDNATVFLVNGVDHNNIVDSPDFVKVLKDFMDSPKI